MLTKTLDQVAAGEIFKVNNINYVKIAEVRVSCCRTVNCHVLEDSNQRTFFPGNTVVETNG
jgi:hypothetical protein